MPCLLLGNSTVCTLLTKCLQVTSGAQVTVITRRSDKSSIEQYGAPDEFLNSIKNLLGEQVFKGKLQIQCKEPLCL